MSGSAGVVAASVASLRCNGSEMSLDEFKEWRQANPGLEIAHIKGFSGGMKNHYREDVMQELVEVDVIAFDGDRYQEGSFTELVPLFLLLSEQKRALAFKFDSGVAGLKEKWDTPNVGPMQKLGRDIWQQLAIVAIDKDRARQELVEEMNRLPATLPGWASDFYALGRTALRATGAQRVVSLGGGGITGWEAEATVGEKVSWTIFAISRGKKEEHPTLLDWSERRGQEHLGALLDLRRGRDPEEATAFAGSW